jgi:hypothetical protein
VQQTTQTTPVDGVESMTHPAWCDGEWCWAYTAEQAVAEGGDPEPGGYHESAWVDIATSNVNRPRKLSVQAKLDHGKPASLEVILSTGKRRKDPVLFLSREQATKLRDLLDDFICERGQVNPDTLAALARIQKRFDDAERAEHRAYCLGWVDGTDGRAPEFEVAR